MNEEDQKFAVLGVSATPRETNMSRYKLNPLVVTSTMRIKAMLEFALTFEDERLPTGVMSELIRMLDSWVEEPPAFLQANIKENMATNIDMATNFFLAVVIEGCNIPLDEIQNGYKEDMLSGKFKVSDTPSLLAELTGKSTETMEQFTILTIQLTDAMKASGYMKAPHLCSIVNMLASFEGVVELDKKWHKMMFCLHVFKNIKTEKKNLVSAITQPTENFNAALHNLAVAVLHPESMKRLASIFEQQ
jgi:hypothetical protein